MLALVLPEVVKVLQCSLQGLFKPYHRLETEVPLSPLAAVVVVSARQGHTHRREGGLDGEQGTQHPAEQLNHHSDEVHQPIGEVAAGCVVAKTSYHTCDEVPEWQRGVVGDEIGLQRTMWLRSWVLGSPATLCDHLSTDF